MDTEPTPHIVAKSNNWIWIAFIPPLLCMALVPCVVLSAAGVFSLRTIWYDRQDRPEPITTQPLQTPIPYTGNLPSLDYKADPLFGSVNLQRGFTPDPFTTPALGGGNVDTSEFDFGCGFTSPAPTFTFTLSGGASEGFLRIYFMTGGGVDTTLLVRTPDREWLCADDSTFGNGKDPVMDLEFAPSGEYAVWVGSWESSTNAAGSLFITQSKKNTP